MSNLKQALDAEYQWPAAYTFKFVVPRSKKQDLSKFFPEHLIEWKESRTGKYCSLTCTQTMMSSDAIIDLYTEIKENIPEVIGI